MEYIAPVLVVGTREEEETLLQKEPLLRTLDSPESPVSRNQLDIFPSQFPICETKLSPHWCLDFVQRHHPENGASAEGCKEAATSVSSMPPVAEAIDQGCTWKEPSLSPGPQAEAMAVPSQWATLLLLSCHQSDSFQLCPVTSDGNTTPAGSEGTWTERDLNCPGARMGRMTQARFLSLRYFYLFLCVFFLVCMCVHTGTQA